MEVQRCKYKGIAFRIILKPARTKIKKQRIHRMNY